MPTAGEVYDNPMQYLSFTITAPKDTDFEGQYFDRKEAQGRPDASGQSFENGYVQCALVNLRMRFSAKNPRESAHPFHSKKRTYSTLKKRSCSNRKCAAVPVEKERIPF